MAAIPGYEYDIYISYSHVDNVTFPGQNNGWVQQFYEYLNSMLAMRFGRKDMVKIWWDPQLIGDDNFDASSLDGIDQSAIMICLNSASYANSAFCMKELQTFYNKAQKEKNGLVIGNRTRLIHVLLNNLHYETWPEELSGSVGFSFNDASDVSDYGDVLNPASLEYKDAMKNLRDCIYELISDMIELN